MYIKQDSALPVKVPSAVETARTLGLGKRKQGLKQQATRNMDDAIVSCPQTVTPGRVPGLEQ